MRVFEALQKKQVGFINPANRPILNHLPGYFHVPQIGVCAIFINEYRGQIKRFVVTRL